MKDLIIFSKINNLDNQNLRWQLGRIPEVSMAIREFGKILSGLLAMFPSNFPESVVASVDLTDLLWDEEFEKQPFVFKELLKEAVLWGLYSRYAFKFSHPDYIVGNSKDSLVSQIITGPVSISDFIKHNLEFYGTQMNESFEIVGSGCHFIYKRNNEGFYDFLHKEPQRIIKLLSELKRSGTVDRFIYLGILSKEEKLEKFEETDFKVQSLLKMDPLLSWFWKDSGVQFEISA